MTKAYVVAVGMTDFAPHHDLIVHDLVADAVQQAMSSISVDPERIEAAFAGHAYQGPCFGQKSLMRLRMEGIPVHNVENACASGATALKGAVNAVKAGDVQVALVLGGEKLTKKGGGFLPIVSDDLDSSMGRVMPSAFAMMAKMHMREYGTTVEQLAGVAVKNRRNATLNPRCHMSDELTIDDVLDSPVIAEPITRNMCCPISDGAAAAIIASESEARKLTDHPVEISACVLNSGHRTRYGIVDTRSEMTARASAAAYDAAGISAQDVDVCEMHDPFAIAELIHYEDLGFCGLGQSGEFLEEGRADLDGEVAVSPSGGLLSKGHPLGATGVAQIAELYWQLTGAADARQVRNAQIGLAHVVGGGVTGLESGACSVTILRA
ncbi:thiolase family protein [Candidatus Foliamicus sp.]